MYMADKTVCFFIFENVGRETTCLMCSTQRFSSYKRGGAKGMVAGLVCETVSSFSTHLYAVIQKLQIDQQRDNHRPKGRSHPAPPPHRTWNVELVAVRPVLSLRWSFEFCSSAPFLRLFRSVRGFLLENFCGKIAVRRFLFFTTVAYTGVYRKEGHGYIVISKTP
jgi:hypothetical protein